MSGSFTHFTPAERKEAHDKAKENVFKRQRLNAKFPGSKAELIEILRTSTVEVTKCKPAQALGAYPNIFEKER